MAAYVTVRTLAILAPHSGRVLLLLILTCLNNCANPDEVPFLCLRIASALRLELCLQTQWYLLGIFLK